MCGLGGGWNEDRLSNSLRKQRARHQTEIRYGGRTDQTNPIRSALSAVLHGDHGRSPRATHHHRRSARNDQADRAETPGVSRCDHVGDDGSAAVHRILSEAGGGSGESAVRERDSGAWTNVSRNKFVMILTESKQFIIVRWRKSE